MKTKSKIERVYAACCGKYKNIKNCDIEEYGQDDPDYPADYDYVCKNGKGCKK